MTQATTIEVVVRDIAACADGVIAIELEGMDAVPLPVWSAGAHIDVMLPNGLVRQYSLCGVPGDAHWRIAVLREAAGGGGSTFLHDGLRRGDVLRASGPRNNFALADAQSYLFIAGGIGITPILPMLHEATARRRPWTLVYGGRTRVCMAFLDELQAYDSADIRLVPQDEAGLIDLQQLLAVPQRGTAIYCCGPDELIDAVEGATGSWPPGSVYRERFKPKPVASSLPEGAFEVELALSGTVLTVEDDDSLLEVLEQAGHRVTNSCRAGICGTCVLKVVSGVCDHRDDLLDDEQRASNAMILPCVSRAKSKRLVLEL